MSNQAESTDSLRNCSNNQYSNGNNGESTGDLPDRRGSYGTDCPNWRIGSPLYHHMESTPDLPSYRVTYRGNSSNLRFLRPPYHHMASTQDLPSHRGTYYDNSSNSRFMPPLYHYMDSSPDLPSRHITSTCNPTNQIESSLNHQYNQDLQRCLLNPINQINLSTNTSYQPHQFLEVLPACWTPFPTNQPSLLENQLYSFRRLDIGYPFPTTRHPLHNNFHSPD